MTKPFVYGVSVEGNLFTDRSLETKRLLLNFEHGINSILISPRRMGKTSLVKKVISQLDTPNIVVVFMDIYKCRSEYDFYDRFASAVIQATASRLDKMMETAREFLMGITPKITYSPEPNTDFSFSLGINPKAHQPEDILNLPEAIARKRGIQIVVCIDEFQQIGEMSNSLVIQKTIRSVWQHHQHTSYCLFGSKKHMMSKMFYTRSMPFYQFGDLFFLKKIPTQEWIQFICRRFNEKGKSITEKQAEWITSTVANYSAYVQQLAWNVYAVSGTTVTDEDLHNGLQDTLAQVSPLFVEQTSSLTNYQLNFIRAICQGIHTDFTKKEVTEQFAMGTRNNLLKIKEALSEKELIEIEENGIFLSDPLFELWFKREMM